MLIIYSQVLIYQLSININSGTINPIRIILTTYSSPVSLVGTSKFGKMQRGKV